MAVKANLKIILKANDVVVAESDDALLWQKVLAAMHSPAAAGAGLGDVVAESFGDSDEGAPEDAIGKLAKRLDVSRDQVIGACDPSTEAPYIHLDGHHWEDLKRNTPSRGSAAISATVLALTLLVLWKDAAALDRPTLRDATAVGETIGVSDGHAARSLRNCEWLQERNGQVRLNPTLTSRAIAVARAYCGRTPIQE